MHSSSDLIHVNDGLINEGKREWLMTQIAQQSVKHDGSSEQSEHIAAHKI